MNLAKSQYQEIWNNILDEYKVLLPDDVSINSINPNLDINLNSNNYLKIDSKIYVYSLSSLDNVLIDIDIFHYSINTINDYIEYSTHSLNHLNIQNIRLNQLLVCDNQLQALKFMQQTKKSAKKLADNMAKLFNTSKTDVAKSIAAQKSWQNPEIAAKRIKNNAQRKRVKCITTGAIFNSSQEAADYYKISYTTIQRACNKIIKGIKDPDNPNQLLELEYLDQPSKTFQEKVKTYAIYNLYYKDKIVFVICSSLPKQEVLPYQKCHKNAPAYQLIQNKGYQHFRLELVQEGIANRTLANEQKIQHINNLYIQGHKLYNQKI